MTNIARGRRPLTDRRPIRAASVSLSLVLALAACNGDGESAPVGSPVVDDDSTAVIVAPSTTAAAPRPTADPADPTDTSEPAEPTVTTEPTEAVDGTAAPATTHAPPGTTAPPATAPPTTEPPPTVGSPVVAAEPIGVFEAPLDLAVRPGDDALYIVEQDGRVVRTVGEDRTVVADIRDRTNANGEQGLLGLAFTPAGDRAVFNYTGRDGATVIAEYPVDDDGTIDVDAERVVLTVAQPYSNHNAGDVVFGPDGLLYIALGDGGAGGDPDRYSHDPTSLLGSLLRIDPTPSGDLGYTIPADNPFAAGDFQGRSGRPEVWAWGLRNPWRIAFDPVTDDLWIPDVGQNAVEEVNLVSPTADAAAGRGIDFGWSAFEGTDRFNTDVPDTGTMLPPVLTYRHGSDGCSVSGGVPYRGTAIPELAPAYVYTDFCSGIVWALDLAGQRNLTLMTGFNGVAAIRPGPDGELYLLELGGTVYRLVPG